MKMKMPKRIIPILISTFMVGIFSHTMAQETGEQQPKNVIKLEITHALYPRSFVMSYERVTKLNQSFCVTAGYEEFPPLVDVNSSMRVRQNLKRNGFKAGMEYRFYLRSENRHPAPHGTYIGPYLTLHNFNNKRAIEVDYSGAAEQAELETDFNVLNIGIQLGHQFVFGNRWTVDVVAIGPAVAKYHARLKLNGEFTFDKHEVQSEILLKLLDRFPMLEDILTDKEISSKGRFDAWSYGWRAQLHVGYYFGRKR
jgi:hypothetical protein